MESCGGVTVMVTEFAGRQLDGQPTVGVAKNPFPGLVIETVVFPAACDVNKVVCVSSALPKVTGEATEPADVELVSATLMVALKLVRTA